MANKRYAEPEAVLSEVIALIERDGYSAARRAATLLLQGPLLIAGIERLGKWPPNTEDLALLQRELRAFLWSVIREAERGEIGAVGLSTHGPVTFYAHRSRAFTFAEHDDPGVSIEGGHPRRRDPSQIFVEGKARDLIAVQLALLLQTVGLRNVQRCGVSDCDRLFVKFHGRKYCSPKCQKRDYMRGVREEEARERARQRARRRR